MYSAERQGRILRQSRAARRVRVATPAEDLGVANEPAVATRSGRLTDARHRRAARVLGHVPAGAAVGDVGTERCADGPQVVTS